MNPFRLGSVAAAVVLAAFGATACSPKVGSQYASQALAAQGVGPQLTETDMPHPRPGLWRESSAVGGAQQTCHHGELLTAFTVRPGDCQVSRQHTPDGGVVMDETCHTGDGGKTSARAVAHGDVSTAFEVDVAIASEGGRSPSMAMGDHLQYQRLGDCPPGAPAQGA